MVGDCPPSVRHKKCANMGRLHFTVLKHEGSAGPQQSPSSRRHLTNDTSRLGRRLRRLTSVGL